MIKPAVIETALDQDVRIPQVAQCIQTSVLTEEGKCCSQIPSGCLHPELMLPLGFCPFFNTFQKHFP